MLLVSGYMIYDIFQRFLRYASMACILVVLLYVYEHEHVCMFYAIFKWYILCIIIYILYVFICYVGVYMS